MKIGLKTTALSLFFLLIGFGVGFVLDKGTHSRCSAENFEHINPDLVCKLAPVVSKQGYSKLKADLEKFISDKKQEGIVSSVSIYFRDLHNGPTLGMNEYEKFSPASLLKLPLFLTYLNLSENNPAFLETKIGFEEKNLTQKQYFPSAKIAQNNTPYTINTLLEYMIEYSDNNSYYALNQYLRQVSPNTDLLRETFLDLGIIDPQNFADQTLSVKSYGSIFVQLYHSSFFSKKELSEQALSLLSKSDFKEGITLGVPTELEIAHKFGERSDLPNNEKQLHDCGIVYYPKNPYLLCVMTRGTDFKQLSHIIGEISKMTYKEFDSRKI